MLRDRFKNFVIDWFFADFEEFMSTSQLFLAFHLMIMFAARVTFG